MPIVKIEQMSPQEILKFYRAQSGHEVNEQAVLFEKLPLEEKLELLFYMCSHTTMSMQYVHSLVAPDEAKTVTLDQLIESLPEKKDN